MAVADEARGEDERRDEDGGDARAGEDGRAGARGEGAGERPRAGVRRRGGGRAAAPASEDVAQRREVDADRVEHRERERAEDDGDGGVEDRRGVQRAERAVRERGEEPERAERDCRAEPERRAEREAAAARRAARARAEQREVHGDERQHARREVEEEAADEQREDEQRHPAAGAGPFEEPRRAVLAAQQREVVLRPEVARRRMQHDHVLEQRKAVAVRVVRLRGRGGRAGRVRRRARRGEAARLGREAHRRAARLERDGDLRAGGERLLRRERDGERAHGVFAAEVVRAGGGGEGAGRERGAVRRDARAERVEEELVPGGDVERDDGAAGRGERRLRADGRRGACGGRDRGEEDGDGKDRAHGEKIPRRRRPFKRGGTIGA